MKIKDLPPQIRPRERAWREGIHVLSDAELLAILLRSGRKGTSAYELAQKLLTKTNGSIETLAHSSPSVLRAMGTGRVQALSVASALELGKRMHANHSEPQTLDDALEWVGARIRMEQTERFFVILLDNRNQCVDIPVCVSEGSRYRVHADVREVLRVILQRGAPRAVLVHNHPSQDPSPSAQDQLFTKQLIEAAAWADVEIVDHVILTRTELFSFRAAGYLDPN